MPETQGQDSLPGILASIVATKRLELDALRPRVDELESTLDRVAPPRDFRGALARPGSVSLIAECKRRSPGAGPIRPDLDPVELVRGYERAGASAVSVLTDQEYFGGSLDDLAAVHEAISLPALQKDFTLDTAHVIEARAGGHEPPALALTSRDYTVPTALNTD